MSLLLLLACSDSPPPAPPPRAPLPALGSARPASVGPLSPPVEPLAGASDCVLLSGPWPGELTGCYDEAGRLRGVELDVAPDDAGPALVALRDAYAPVDVEVRPLGGAAWQAPGVRLEVVREPARMHLRARVAG